MGKGTLCGTGSRNGSRNARKVKFFLVIPFYLKSVLVQSANCLNNVYNGK
jgi:hypothetical protein